MIDYPNDIYIIYGDINKHTISNNNFNWIIKKFIEILF